VMLVPPGVWAYECPFCDLGVMIQLFESLTVVVKHGPNPEHVRQMSVETLLALTHEHFRITGPREISDWLVEVHRRSVMERESSHDLLRDAYIERFVDTIQSHFRAVCSVTSTRDVRSAASCTRTEKMVQR
jgi:hypothetical protein